MHAEITIKFRFLNACNESDLKETGMTFEEMVAHLIREEGLFGVVDDKYEIVSVKEIKSGESEKPKGS